MMTTAEHRLAELGIVVPQLPPPVAVYVPAVRTGRVVYASGQTPTIDGVLQVRGRLGEGVSVEEGQRAARLAALNCLAEVRALLGSLDAVSRVLRLTGYVASAPGFGEQPYVMNGASELMEQVFGDAGRHARSAIGVAELPFGAPVEVELIVEAAEGS
ncbi:MAG TPA: RidA family protein [Cellulomonadaceae bacterium]|jgi:enamine deaminase RidA (YjgF/YER057c/UK114 family)|nr:RidA family protein [Cellulomonadaceae bacterium]